jgi:DNA polymerase-3 subunit gamma/tau
MSYQVLARKWRPQNFKEMVGQEHVLKALIHALEVQRLHHAYLFTGTRGVGKTTIGRILAKCLNCEKGITAEPCGQCSACLEIAEGRFVDLIEIDAASRTKVEDMRELLDNVQYAPTRGRFKVYLIDEVHMLSQSSFNALLKTLEEPPEHVKFLLATTDPQKLPVTILSRCLQFNLKNMPAEQIVFHLSNILQHEKVEFVEQALWLLARAANGSMRDALSLTDQAIGYGNNRLVESEVSAMLGTVDQQQVFHLLNAISTGQAQALLDAVATMAEYAPNYSDVLASLISVLHRITIEQVVPGSTDNAMGDRDKVVNLAQKLTGEDVQLYYQIALMGRKDLDITPDPRIGLEMTLLRMLAFTPNIDEAASLSTANPDNSDPGSSSETGNESNEQSSSVAQAPISETSLSHPTEPEQPDQPAQHVAPSDLGTTNQSNTNISTSNISTSNISPLLEKTAGESSSTESLSNKSPSNESPSNEGGAVNLPDTHIADAGKPEDIQQTNASENNPQPEYVADADFMLRESPPIDAYESDLQADIPPWDELAHDGLSSDDLSSDGRALTPSQAEVNEGSPVPQLFQREPESKKPDAGDAIQTIQYPADHNTSHQTSTPDNAPSQNATPSDPSEINWVTDVHELGLSGLTLNIAGHSVLRKEEDGLVLAFEPNYYQLFKDNKFHEQRLKDALIARYGIHQIQFVEGIESGETPEQYSIRHKQERQLKAEKIIESDPFFNELMAHFDGRLLENSVRPRQDSVSSSVNMHKS